MGGQVLPSLTLTTPDVEECMMDGADWFPQDHAAGVRDGLCVSSLGNVEVSTGGKAHSPQRDREQSQKRSGPKGSRGEMEGEEELVGEVEKEEKGKEEEEVEEGGKEEVGKEEEEEEVEEEGKEEEEEEEVEDGPVDVALAARLSFGSGNERWPRWT
ncbi:unnamed protein product [Arctogadus glacialis]